jgi:hypothetical protein
MHDSGGADRRPLADGDWDSFTFETTTTPPYDAQPANPIAALPPPFALPGDYSGDGQVNVDDYSLWRAAFGSSLQLHADGSGNGMVDAADYVVWRKHFTASTAVAASLPSVAIATPEPTTISVVLTAFGLASLLHRKEKC